MHAAFSHHTCIYQDHRQQATRYPCQSDSIPSVLARTRCLYIVSSFFFFHDTLESLESTTALQITSIRGIHSAVGNCYIISYSQWQWLSGSVGLSYILHGGPFSSTSSLGSGRAYPARRILLLGLLFFFFFPSCEYAEEAGPLAMDISFPTRFPATNLTRAVGCTWRMSIPNQFCHIWKHGSYKASTPDPAPSGSHSL